MLPDMLGDCRMRGENDVALRLNMPDQLFEQPNARAMTGDVWMHSQLEQPAFFICSIKLSAKYFKNAGRRRIWADRLKAMHIEVHGIVTNPFHGNFDNSGRLVVQ